MNSVVHSNWIAREMAADFMRQVKGLLIDAAVDKLRRMLTDITVYKKAIPV